MHKRRSPENPTAAVKRLKHGGSENVLALTLAPAWQAAASDDSSVVVSKMKAINNVLSNLRLRETDNLIPFVALGGGGDHQTSTSSYSSDVPAAGLVSSTTSVRKVLEKSDVNSLCRLMLKKEVVESQILCHWSQEEKAGVVDGEGHRVLVYDRDTASLHAMTFKRWGSSKCYVLNSNWSVEFVKRRALLAGDEIGLHWDTSNRRFVFSVLLRKFL